MNIFTYFAFWIDILATASFTKPYRNPVKKCTESRKRFMKWAIFKSFLNIPNGGIISIPQLKFSSIKNKIKKKSYFFWFTMNYPKKPGFNLYQSRHCAYYV